MEDVFFYITTSENRSINDLHLLCTQLNSKLIAFYYKFRAQGNRNLPLIPPSNIPPPIAEKLLYHSLEAHKEYPNINKKHQREIDKRIEELYALSTYERNIIEQACTKKND